MPFPREQPWAQGTEEEEEEEEQEDSVQPDGWTEGGHGGKGVGDLDPYTFQNRLFFSNSFPVSTLLIFKDIYSFIIKNN